MKIDDVGEDSVVMGDVSARNIGDRSVVIGATDSNGNTVLTTGMAVGYKAKAGPGSIAIGAYAGAGDGVFDVLSEIEATAAASGDQQVVEAVKGLVVELNTKRDKDSIQAFWTIISNSVNLAQAGILLGQLYGHLKHLL